MKLLAFNGIIYDIEKDCFIVSDITSSKRAFSSKYKEYNNDGFHFIFKPYVIDVDDILSDISSSNNRECVKQALTAYFKPFSKDNK